MVRNGFVLRTVNQRAVLKDGYDGLLKCNYLSLQLVLRNHYGKEGAISMASRAARKHKGFRSQSPIAN